MSAPSSQPSRRDSLGTWQVAARFWRVLSCRPGSPGVTLWAGESHWRCLGRERLNHGSLSEDLPALVGRRGPFADFRAFAFSIMPKDPRVTDPGKNH